MDKIQGEEGAIIIIFTFFISCQNISKKKSFEMEKTAGLRKKLLIFNRKI